MSLTYAFIFSSPFLLPPRKVSKVCTAVDGGDILAKSFAIQIILDGGLDSGFLDSVPGREPCCKTALLTMEARGTREMLL